MKKLSTIWNMAIHAHKKKKVPNSRNKLEYACWHMLKLFHINDLYYCQKLTAHLLLNVVLISLMLLFSEKL